jgi:RNA polymerase sigma-70 factor, ECF subfamily
VTTDAAGPAASPGDVLARAGTEGAVAEPSWDELATRLRPFLRRRVASEPDADDVLQDVLLRMHRGLPGLRDDDRLSAWMYRIARTAIVDHLRARQRHPLAPPDDQAAAAAGPPDAASLPAEDDRAVACEVAQSLAAFVARLPSPYREAITLAELEERTQRQAAEMMGVSLSGMKSRVQRGRARLRAMLEACCELAVDARGKLVACEPRTPHNVPSGCCGRGT